MTYNEVAVKVAAAKVVDGNPSESPDGGLFMNSYICLESCLGRMKAGLMLQKLFRSEIGDYHIL